MKNNTNNFTNEMMNNNGVLAKHEKTITVYALWDGFCVDVDRGVEDTEFYIYHKCYGIKSMMFGLRNCDMWSEEEMILANAEEHMEFYREDYMKC